MDELLEASSGTGAGAGGVKPRVRKTPLEKRAIVDFLAAGGSAEDAAARFGIARAAAAKLLAEQASATSSTADAELETGGTSDSVLGKRTRDAAGDDVVAFVRHGASVAQAATKFGLTRAEVAKLVDDAGLPAAQQEEMAAIIAGASSGADAVAVVDATVSAAAAEGIDEDLHDSDGLSDDKKRVRLSQEDKAALLQFVAHGGSLAAAADKFGISQQAVVKLVKIKTRANVDGAELDGLPGDALGSVPTGVVVEGGEAVDALGAVAPTPLNPVLDTGSHVVVSGNSVLGANGNAAGDISTPEAADASAVTRGSSGARKGRRVRKTNSEKLEILAFVEKGGSQGAAAEKFGVSRTAVTKMVKEKEAICAQARSESTNNRKVLQYQHKLSIIEDMLYKWQIQVEIDSPTLKITGDLLQSKAMEFRNKVLADYSNELPDEVVLSLTDFKASNGWLHRYMQRKSIRALPKHEDASHGTAGDRANAEQRIQRIRAQLTQVPAQCIWTLSEIVLRNRSTSGRLDAAVNMDARSLDRVSVALAASASGEKLRMQVVGKEEHLASLTDIDVTSVYGLQFRGNSRVWHDSYAVLECIQTMNREAKARKEVWFLVLDSSASHVAAAHGLNPMGSYRNGFKFESMVLLFLPPSTTNDIQPLHQGVISQFKRTFRYEMLQTLIRERRAWQATQGGLPTEQVAASTAGGVGVDPVVTEDGGAVAIAATNGESFDIHAHTTIRNTLSWLQRAWDSVYPKAIQRAWFSCPFLPSQVVDIKLMEEASAGQAEGSTLADIKDLLATATPFLKDLGLSDLGDDEDVIEAEVVEFDKSDSGSPDEVAKDDEIVIESLSMQGLLRDTQRTLDEIKEPGPEIASVSEACGSVARLLRFVVRSNHEQISTSDRRTARANLLALQRILLKARSREPDDEATAYTV